MWNEAALECKFFPLSLSSLYNFAHLRDTCIIQTFTYHVYRPLPQKITKQNKKKGVETFLKVNTRIYINIRYFPHLTALTIGNYYPLIFANEFINFLTRITLQKIICILVDDVNSFKIGKSFGTLIKMDAYFILMKLCT